MRYEVQIRAGRLIMETRREDLPLETLLAFASRENPKRGFLFVSKVLGKHIPCRPSRMRHVYQCLAARLQAMPGPILVIGMAETATCLGAGVADSLARTTEREDILYLHTTRHALPNPTLVRFDESHSHAPDHILYAPQGVGASLFPHARSLVLVDDEISTGRTLRLLAQGVAHHLPRLQVIALTAIVNWLSVEQQQTLATGLCHSVEFVSLLDGDFVFEPDPGFNPSLPAQMYGHGQSRYAREDTGRTGIMMPDQSGWFEANPSPEGPLVIVGTGEFAFAPFVAAERLESQGRDVLFQSTTRSPILEGDAIQSKLVFMDEHGEGVVNYLYNLPTERRVIVTYEHPVMAASHALPALVDAQVWALD